jgi:hypothetical protein
VTGGHRFFYALNSAGRQERGTGVISFKEPHMALRAKFHVTAVEKQGENEMVTLMAVYSADPNDANHSWSKYTPWGELKMNISNPLAQGQLEVGAEWYIDLTPAADDYEATITEAQQEAEYGE